MSTKKKIIIVTLLGLFSGLLFAGPEDISEDDSSIASTVSDAYPNEVTILEKIDCTDYDLETFLKNEEEKRAIRERNEKLAESYREYASGLESLLEKQRAKNTDLRSQLKESEEEKTFLQDQLVLVNKKTKKHKKRTRRYKRAFLGVVTLGLGSLLFKK